MSHKPEREDVSRNREHSAISTSQQLTMVSIEISLWYLPTKWSLVT